MSELSVYEVLNRKRRGEALEPHVIEEFINRYTAGGIPDYQMSALLMAVAINGKLCAAQGLLPGFKPAGLVYEYDPAKDAWTQKNPMPHPVHHAAVTAMDVVIGSA